MSGQSAGIVYTRQASAVIALAEGEARRLVHNHVGTEHVLAAMLSTPNSVGAQVLSCLGVNINELAAEVKKLFKTGKAPASEAVPQTPRLVGALMYAAQEAESFGHTKVGTEHMLLGLLLEYDSVAAQLLMNIGVTVDRVRACIAELSANPSEDDGSEIRPDKPAE